MSETVPPRKARITASPLQASPDYWLPRIQESYDEFEGTLRSSLAAAIKLGKRLIEAKERVGHGNFGRMFAGHEEPLPKALPFTDSWARKIMGIAANPVIENRSHANDLPKDLETIYQLATMKAADLGAAIESGRITPETTRAEAKQIKREFQEAAPPDPDEPPKRVRAVPVRTQQDAFDEFTAKLDCLVGQAVSEFPNIRQSIKSYLKLVSESIRT